MINYAHSYSDNKDDWHQLADHLKATAKLAGQFAEEFGEGAEILGQQLGMLHDLGKYSKEFQQKLEGKPDQVNHSTAGAQEALNQYPKLGYFLAYAIAGHHAGLANGKGFNGKRRSLAERLKDNKLPILSKVWQQEITLAEEKDFHKYLQGMKRCKDHQVFQCAFLIRMLFSCLIDADRLDTEHFYRQAKEKPSNDRGFAEIKLTDLSGALNNYLQKKSQQITELNNWRNKILTTVRANAEVERGVFSLTVPTGGGKTLSSLAFALDHAIIHGLRRIIYVIPYTNIIEQTAQVFREALGDYKNVVLEHHSSFVADSIDDNYQGRTKLKLAMENWDAPIIVTTAVQFFESLFANRPTSCRKLHNISNSVVILDEAQTMPLPVLRPCIVSLKELVANYRGSIVLCTATQPALTSKQFTDRFDNVRELAPEQDKMFNFFARVTIDRQIKEWDDSILLQKIIDQRQVLCIVNNRRHARSLVDNLQNCDAVYLLTTLMCAKHRQKVLTEIRDNLNNKQLCRVIATSLVEAGVDLDFPTVFRAEAGLDSIVQAAGRCNREGKNNKADSRVVVFSTEQQWQPPHELRQFMQIAKGVFRRGDDLLTQATVENYFRELYWQKGQQQLDSKGILKNLQSERLESLPFEKIAEDFVMIESNQRPVIIAYDDCAKKLLKELERVDYCWEIARQLQSFLVQIPDKGYQKILSNGQLRYVGEKNFDKQFAVVKDGFYHDDYGLDLGELIE